MLPLCFLSLYIGCFLPEVREFFPTESITETVSVFTCKNTVASFISPYAEKTHFVELFSSLYMGAPLIVFTDTLKLFCTLL